MRGFLKKASMTVAAAIVCASCGGSNYFAPMSHKDSDDAVYEDIKKLLNAAQWDAAITRFGELSAAYRSQPEVAMQYSSAYAGKCGLKFRQFVEGIGASGALLGVMMHAFDGVTVDAASCQTAQDIIDQTLGSTAAGREAAYPDEAGEINFYMAILGMVKIGTTLQAAVGGGFSSACVDDDDNLRDEEVVRVGTGLALVMDNFTAVAGRLDAGSRQALEDMDTQCGLLNPNPCTIADRQNAAWSDPTILKAFRGLTESDSLGIGSCSAPNPFLCCP